ncbi:hypothetical protein CRUP_036562, partial [Coryphaenoides rupestris]
TKNYGSGPVKYPPGGTCCSLLWSSPPPKTASASQAERPQGGGRGAPRKRLLSSSPYAIQPGGRSSGIRDGTSTCQRTPIYKPFTQWQTPPWNARLTRRRTTVSEEELHHVRACLQRWRSEVWRAAFTELKANIERVSQVLEGMYRDNSLCQVPYRLHAVLVHEGQASAGHYWAYIHDHANRRWMKYNDIAVTESLLGGARCGTRIRRMHQRQRRLTAVMYGGRADDTGSSQEINEWEEQFCQAGPSRPSRSRPRRPESPPPIQLRLTPGRGAIPGLRQPQWTPCWLRARGCSTNARESREPEEPGGAGGFRTSAGDTGRAIEGEGGREEGTEEEKEEAARQEPVEDRSSSPATVTSQPAVAVADAGPEPAAPSRSAALSPDQESAASDPKEKLNRPLQPPALPQTQAARGLHHHQHHHHHQLPLPLVLRSTVEAARIHRGGVEGDTRVEAQEEEEEEEGEEGEEGAERRRRRRRQRRSQQAPESEVSEVEIPNVGRIMSTLTPAMQGVIMAIAKARQAFDTDGPEAGLIKEESSLQDDVRLHHALVYFFQNKAPGRIIERALLEQFTDRNLSFDDRAVSIMREARSKLRLIKPEDMDMDEYLDWKDDYRQFRTVFIYLLTGLEQYQHGK